jgi:hypothetical protein
MSTFVEERGRAGGAPEDIDTILFPKGGSVNTKEGWEGNVKKILMNCRGKLFTI